MCPQIQSNLTHTYVLDNLRSSTNGGTPLNVPDHQICDVHADQGSLKVRVLAKTGLASRIPCVHRRGGPSGSTSFTSVPRVGDFGATSCRNPRRMPHRSCHPCGDWPVDDGQTPGRGRGRLILRSLDQPSAMPFRVHLNQFEVQCSGSPSNGCTLLRHTPDTARRLGTMRPRWLLRRGPQVLPLPPRPNVRHCVPQIHSRPSRQLGIHRDTPCDHPPSAHPVGPTDDASSRPRSWSVPGEQSTSRRSETRISTIISIAHRMFGRPA